MVYHPLSTLMLAGIREVIVISAPDDAAAVRRLLGDGTQLGMTICHAVQPRPDGVPQAFTIAADFVGGEKVALALGDNILHGPGVGLELAAHTDVEGALVFAHRVRNPGDYGVVELDRDGQALSVEEKPRSPRSDFAVPGLYFYDNDVVDVARSVKPGVRGRLEITAVNEVYRRQGRLRVQILGPETAWLDTGAYESMAAAAEYVRTVEVQEGQKVGCIEEVAWRRGWIDDVALLGLARRRRTGGYGQYLSLIAGQRRDHTVLEIPAQPDRTARAR
jgi:glucose-1-phosphate thymidylyltransferase